MKRGYLVLCGAIIAVVLSAFTPKADVYKYLVYDGSGTQKDITNYSTVTTQPSHVAGTGKLNWFRVLDIGNNGIDTDEFEDDFEARDLVNTSLNLLSDETADVNGQLDIKN